jgi:hypothetical protein
MSLSHSHLFLPASLPFFPLGRQFFPRTTKNSGEFNRVLECLFDVGFNDLDDSDNVIRLGLVPPVNTDYVGIQNAPLKYEISAIQERGG